MCACIGGNLKRPSLNVSFTCLIYEGYPYMLPEQYPGMRPGDARDCRLGAGKLRADDDHTDGLDEPRPKFATLSRNAAGL